MANEIFGPFGEAEAERRRVVNLCYRLTGDWHAAEDLAQEALIEAWRHSNDLRNPAARRAWMSGIATNVCRRWARRRGRELSHLADQHGMDGENGAGVDEILADDFDVEIELERQELVELLDRAMGMLPPSVRRLLVAKYVMEQPLAEIAGQTGLSEGAIAMRLQRGRLALKRLLNSDLRAEAAEFGLADSGETGWQQTRIWCPHCGNGYLRGYLEAETGLFMMHCPACSKAADDYLWQSEMPDLFSGLKSFKTIILRDLSFIHDQYRQALPAMRSTCALCQGPALMLGGLPEGSWLSRHSSYGLTMLCPKCNSASAATLSGYLRGSPEVKRFWQQHPRIKTLPARELEAHGRPALLTTYADVQGSDQLDIVTDAETFAILEMNPK